VIFRRKLVVDFGGIAKGFAVDRATEALQKSGVRSGIVNAGGDLRIFGPTRQTIHVRHPDDPQRSAGTVALSCRAMATSATYFGETDGSRTPKSQLVDGRTRRPLSDSISVTVAADDCMTADALTKVVVVLREKAAPFLQRYGADALLLEGNGTPCWAFHPQWDMREQALDSIKACAPLYPGGPSFQRPSGR
jgi:thiamine biosynthesis lipoprotein